jgi:predicted DNA-binding protein (UPF0251 family)
MFIIKVKMQFLGRRKIARIIDKDHSHICFKPCGVRGWGLEKIMLSEDEMEAIRLSDFEGLYQQECAHKMGISRTTFSRIVATAHQKISDALLHNKALIMTHNNTQGKI